MLPGAFGLCYRPLMATEQLSIQSVIDRLKRADKPALTLDASILELLGWTKVVNIEPDKASGRQTRYRYWVDGKGNKISNPPPFTSDLQIAIDLCKKIDPNHVAAVSFGDECSAIIEGYAKAVAATPQLAVCAAALQMMQSVTDRD